MKKHLSLVKTENRSGFKPRLCSQLCVLKKHQYFIVEGYSITGDAPKKFIRVYEYGKCRKQSTSTWPLYIAKTGQKWYPIESITEYLLNQLGAKMGLKMAESRLVYAGNQIRFLSKYFLKPGQELIHGAEIFVGYLEDENLVHQIELQDKAREFFTLDVVKQALEKLCGNDHLGIFSEFVKMLIFDALVGNNDRHFYNWGIIGHINGLHKPYFTPVYDTARGLFWNNSEKKIVNLHRNPDNLKNTLAKYSKNSRPKIGVDGSPNINHFQLVKYVYDNEIGLTKEEIKGLVNQSMLERLLYCIDNDFRFLLSKERRYVIKEILKFRYDTIVSLF